MFLAMLKQSFSNLSVSQEGGCFLSTMLFLTVIYSAHDLRGRKLEVAVSNPRCSDVPSCSTAASNTFISELPTPDNISNYFKSTLSCQTTAEKAASVFLNSAERPEHQDLEGNKIPTAKQKTH